MKKTNSVLLLKNYPFHRRMPQEKLHLKELGPDQLNVIIKKGTCLMYKNKKSD